MKTLDIGRLRADTPACEKLIHFNNAGSSLMPTPVYRAVLDHLALEQTIGGYAAEDQACPILEDFYDAFATLLNCDRAEIAYVENATRAWDMAFYSLPLKEGDRILTVEAEYVSNFLAFLHQARRRGLEIDVVPSDAGGQLDLNAMERMITPKTRLIAITHVPTQGGLVNPAEEVGKIARRHGITYLLDACQSVGQMPLDVEKIGCQLLSGTGRKFLRGPRGTGFLYVSKDIIDRLDPPFIDLHAANWTDARNFEIRPDARRFENWESYVAGRVGLRAAVGYALALGLDQIRDRVSMLADRLRASLSELPGVKVQDLGRVRSGIVTFTKEGEQPRDIQARLDAADIAVSVSSKTSAQLDFGRRGLSQVVRASVHYFNTEDEIGRFCEALGGAK
ncbi:aminotransferase class V-fold PLP-dependent enzyme [Dongia deserti]|uniref:aminotransferase class V-fold PLP-dependent enzyme n=1 Tax=Dongia deserti TaxID=2268030 RepID=UPI000E6547E2|nr:aminotransferase class V-fold PLP-dependent enzyme [Dongia deserti]